MRVKLPIDYIVTAPLRANGIVKRCAVSDVVDIEIETIARDDFPMAVSWQQKALPWDEPTDRRHTCFASGDHWRPVAALGDHLSAFGDDALANLALVNSLLPRTLTRTSRVVEALENEKRVVNLQGETLPIIDAVKVADLELDDLDLRSQFQAKFNLHQRAANMMICDGMLYHRMAEPVLTVTLLSEKRPPDTLTMTVDDASRAYGSSPHERQLHLYSHRIDRADDFRAVFEDRRPSGNYTVYDLIEDIEVYRPDVLRFEDDMDTLTRLLIDVRSALSATPTSVAMQETVEMHRRLGRTMSNDEKVDFLMEIADHRLFKGEFYADLRSQIDLVNDRWRFRPISKPSI